MRILKILSVIVSFIMVFTACDKVNPPYQTGFDCESGNQNVLIEDYTGHTCVNCPGAAETAHDIKSNCEERVIIIAVHAGYFALPAESGNYTYDFRTNAGNEWNDFFGIVSNPNGVVNRVSENGNYILGPGLWAEQATKLLAQNCPVNIEIENTFSITENKLTTKVNADFIEKIEGEYNLIVCITEDHIIKPQKNNDAGIGTIPDILEYEHMHVLRATLGGTWGQTFINGKVDAGQTVSKSLEISFENREWLAENCNVVAFITKKDDKSVLQVNEEKVIQ